MTVNIVMLVKDRPRLTEQALSSLYAHTERGSFSLTVVDDGSQLQTRGVLDLTTTGRDDTVIVRLSRSKGIVGLVRNLGIRAAELYWSRGDLLYMSDNDAYFTPGWLERLLVAWPAACVEGYRILGGYNHPYHAIEGIEVGRPAPVTPYPHGEIREYYTVGGLSWLMEWQTWDRFGMLDAKVVGVAKSEDWEYTQRIRGAGFKVGAVHPHVVHNAGLTSSFGEKAVGHEAMARVAGVVME